MKQMWKQKQLLGCSCTNISMSSALLVLCLVLLSIADGRTLQPHLDTVINTTSSSATALLDSTSSTTTNSDDVQGLITLITAFPLLMGERFPYLSNDPCYPQKLIWIQCSNDVVRRVTALYAGAQYMIGTLPDFSSMDALVTIDFHRNSLYGSIPEFMGNFPKLTYLDLSYNLFTGPLPNSLANNKKIKLNLAGNSLQVPPPPPAAATLIPPPPPTSSTKFGPPTPTTYGFLFQPPPPPVDKSRFPSGSGGGDAFNLPDLGGRPRNKSNLPKILKISIPSGLISTLLGIFGCCCCRRRRTDQKKAAAADHSRVAPQA